MDKSQKHYVKRQKMNVNSLSSRQCCIIPTQMMKLRLGEIKSWTVPKLAEVVLEWHEFEISLFNATIKFYVNLYLSAWQILLSFKTQPECPSPSLVFPKPLDNSFRIPEQKNLITHYCNYLRLIFSH